MGSTPPNSPIGPDGGDRFRYGSMSLLQELMDRPLDPSYAAAAARRQASGLPPNTGVRGWLVLVAALLIGFLFVVAALTLRPSGTTASRDKAELIAQIQARQQRGDELAAQVSAMSGQIQDAQAAALAGQAAQLLGELDRLELLTGEVAVTGPGLVLTVDDSPDTKQADANGEPRDSTGFARGRVTSFDLQILANGLWQAGAEAMSINGQRLTSRSAIRFAGDAILVDYRPLRPPYVLTAIGDGRDLQTRFAETASGAYLKSLGDNDGIASTIAPQTQVEVPRSPTLRLNVAALALPGIPSTAPSQTSPSRPQPTGSVTPTEARTP